MDVEPRLALLASAVGEIKISFARIEARLEAIATSAQVEYLRGRVETLPTTWTMIVAIIGGQVAVAGLMAAIVFGVAHVIGKV